MLRRDGERTATATAGGRRRRLASSRSALLVVCLVLVSVVGVGGPSGARAETEEGSDGRGGGIPNCEEEPCDQVLVDSDENPANRLDTVAGEGEPDPLFWGSLRLLTDQDQTLESLVGSEGCEVGDVAKVVNGIFDCRPDEVDGGDAELLDGLDSTAFPHDTFLVTSSQEEERSGEEIVLESFAYEKPHDAETELVCEYRPSLEVLEGEPDRIGARVSVDGEAVTSVQQTFDKGSPLLHAVLAGLEAGSYRVEVFIGFDTRSGDIVHNPGPTQSSGTCSQVDGRTP